MVNSELLLGISVCVCVCVCVVVVVAIMKVESTTAVLSPGGSNPFAVRNIIHSICVHVMFFRWLLLLLCCFIAINLSPESVLTSVVDRCWFSKVPTLGVA